MGKWELGDIATITMGQSPASETYNDKGTGLPFFQGKTDFGLVCPSVRMYCSKPQKSAKEKDVLISVRAPVGAVNIADRACCIGRGLAAISEKTGVSYYKFLFYYLKHKENEIANMGVGSTFKAISKGDIGTIEIPLPPLPIQQQIADALDCASALIEKRKTQIDKLDLLIKSQFVEIFGDPVTNPMGWEVKRLSDVCIKITDGTHRSPENGPAGDYMYVTAKNIKKYGIDLTNITYIEKNIHNEIYARCNPSLNDVLYIKDGVTTGIAQVNTIVEPFSMLSSVALLKPNKALLSAHLLAQTLNNKRMYTSIRDQMGGAAITRLTIQKIKRIAIPIPYLALQNDFATFVERVEEQKKLLQQSLTKLELTYKSLMQKCFRGEIF